MQRIETVFGPLYDGVSFKAKIKGDEVTGKITIENGNTYLCQNEWSGSECNDKKGYYYSWTMGNIRLKNYSKEYKEDRHIAHDVSDLRLGSDMEYTLFQIAC